MYDVSFHTRRQTKYFFSFKKSDDITTGQGLLFMEGNTAGSTNKACIYMEGYGLQIPSQS